jgi:arylsulfatase A-like enzyme
MSRRPNILWIVTTQWRASACGYAGDPNARTPALDALAAQSVNYTQAVTPALRARGVVDRRAFAGQRRRGLL